MYSLHLSSLRSVALADALSHSADDARIGLRCGHAFADTNYFRHVITYLETIRKQRGMTIPELTRKARLRKGVISRAERQGVIPGILEFKAWTQALGLTWERLWTECLPESDSELCGTPNRFAKGNSSALLRR